jgi:hypothetical protein
VSSCGNRQGWTDTFFPSIRLAIELPDSKAGSSPERVILGISGKFTHSGDAKTDIGGDSAGHSSARFTSRGPDA